MNESNLISSEFTGAQNCDVRYTGVTDQKTLSERMFHKLNITTGIMKNDHNFSKPFWCEISDDDYFVTNLDSKTLILTGAQKINSILPSLEKEKEKEEKEEKEKTEENMIQIIDSTNSGISDSNKNELEKLLNGDDIIHVIVIMKNTYSVEFKDLKSKNIIIDNDTVNSPNLNSTIYDDITSMLDKENLVVSYVYLQNKIFKLMHRVIKNSEPKFFDIKEGAARKIEYTIEANQLT